MDNTVEGKEVEPHLIKTVEQPTLVPTTIYSFNQGPGTKNLEGHVDGHILTSGATFVITRIRALIENILKSEHGRVPMWDDSSMTGRFLDMFGDKVLLSHGLKSNPGCFIGETQVHFEGGRDAISHGLAIAAEGYDFTDKARENRENGSRELITLDTEGQWLKRLLEDEAEGTEMVAMEQDDNGLIQLTKDKDGLEPKIMSSFWAYKDNFLKVGDYKEITQMGEYSFQNIMAIVLRIHNMLYAAHKTLIGEEGLPGGLRSEWEVK